MNRKHGFCNHILERSEFINIHDLVNLAPAKRQRRSQFVCDQILILEQVNLIFCPATSRTAHGRVISAPADLSAVPCSQGGQRVPTFPGKDAVSGEGTPQLVGCVRRPLLEHFPWLIFVNAGFR